MHNILLVGAGQLGSRHLQGLSKLEKNSNIFIIDPSPQSLLITEQRVDEVKERNINHKYFFSEEIKDLPEKIDLAVIATNSDVRKKVILEVCSKTQVKNFILEKFLFQKKKDFFEVKQLFERENIHAWVNCARRLYPEFIDLKNIINNKKVLHMSVTGSNWSMGSNAIHFIDIFSFLLNCTVYQINDNHLISHLFNNKRKGYIEFNGLMFGRFDNGTSFELSSIPGSAITIELRILLNDSMYVIKQIEQKIIIQRKAGTDWIIEEKTFPVYFQSNLTNLAAEQIFGLGTCGLTPFDESVNLHIPIFNQFLKHYNNQKKYTSNEICPIT